MAYLFVPAPQPVVPVEGRGNLPIHRIFCVGRNYAEHAVEMGGEVDRSAPFYSTKSAHSAVIAGSALVYPPRTEDLHHEIELVVALGENTDAVAYGVGLHMTRRDLQAAAKEKRRPWDTGKDFEHSAVLAPMLSYGEVSISVARIALEVNGQVRQNGLISDMVWSVEELIADLSGLYALRPGDLIMTGTTAGVGPVWRGDRIDGLPYLYVTVS